MGKNGWEIVSSGKERLKSDEANPLYSLLLQTVHL